MRADHVIWLMTANDLSTAPPAIRDRMLVVNIPEPSRADRMAIIESILRAAAREHGVTSRAKLPGAAIDELLAELPRQIKRLIGLAFGYAAERGSTRLEACDLRAARRLSTAEPEKLKYGFLSSQE